VIDNYVDSKAECDQQKVHLIHSFIHICLLSVVKTQPNMN